MNWKSEFERLGIAPDFGSFRAALRGRASRVHHAELYFDDGSKKALCELLGIDPRLSGVQRDVALASILGMELVRIHHPSSEFTMELGWRENSGGACEPEKTGQGYTVHEGTGPIRDRTDMERYPWPVVANVDFSDFEWAEKNLPDGMKAYDLSAQFLECSNWLLGYEMFSLSMLEAPEFVDEVLARIADFYLEYIRTLCDFECVGAVWAADDMGYKTQLAVSPNWLKDHILPLHKEAAAIAHEHGKLYLLHSCGKVDDLMDMLIDDVRIDGKHSFEDAVTPVEEAYKRWGGRTGIIGGMDVDFLARSTAAQIRSRTAAMIERTAEGGGYVLGTGNSVTNYIPAENYLAMIHEGFSRASQLR